MAWLKVELVDELREAALKLTPEERAALTWWTARTYVAIDTCECASFFGMKAEAERNGSITPWQAVCFLRNIEPNATA